MSIFIVPDDLRYLSGNNSVNVLIGENGSGKSTLLRAICDFNKYTGHQVIAIANTIYDKFPSSKNIDLLKISSGRSVTIKAISKALVQLVDNEFQRARSMARALEYVGFSPIIRFELVPKNKDYSEQIMKLDLDKRTHLEILRTLTALHDHFSRERFIDVNLHIDNFADIKNSVIFQYFKLEKYLRLLSLWKTPKMSLFRDNKEISLHQASSGELTLITSLIYISSVITRNAIILVDEPENSLHPKWQMEYVKNLLDLFYLYEPSIVIATHSALILNGAELNYENVNVYKGKDGKFFLKKNSSTNVEEIYQDFFNVITPQNRYISEEIIEKLNGLSDKKITKIEFDSFINNLILDSYDEKQQVALKGVLELSAEVIKES